LLENQLTQVFSHEYSPLPGLNGIKQTAKAYHSVLIDEYV